MTDFKIRIPYDELNLFYNSCRLVLKEHLQTLDSLSVEVFKDQLEKIDSIMKTGLVDNLKRGIQ